MGRREIIQYSSIINIKEDTHKLPRVKNSRVVRCAYKTLLSASTRFLDNN